VEAIAFTAKDNESEMGPVKPFPTGRAEIDGSETMAPKRASATGMTSVAASRLAAFDEEADDPKITQPQSTIPACKNLGWMFHKRA
jgi:hypothetical protein